jgi:TPP-dependent pyruvate/acetoin dehydrogenase alpha subunit
MTSAVATADDGDAALAMYETMVAIRRFDEASYDLFLRGRVHGSIHLSSSQEAIAVGFAAAQRPTDLTYCTYRGHSHAIARGVHDHVRSPAGRVLARTRSTRRSGTIQIPTTTMHSSKATRGATSETGMPIA